MSGIRLAGGVGDYGVRVYTRNRTEAVRRYAALFKMNADPLGDEFQQASKQLEGLEQYLLQLWRESWARPSGGLALTRSGLMRWPGAQTGPRTGSRRAGRWTVAALPRSLPVRNGVSAYTTIETAAIMIRARQESTIRIRRDRMSAASPGRPNEVSLDASRGSSSASLRSISSRMRCSSMDRAMATSEPRPATAAEPGGRRSRFYYPPTD